MKLSEQLFECGYQYSRLKRDVEMLEKHIAKSGIACNF